MLVLIATSFFSVEEDGIALALNVPSGETVHVYSIAEGREVLREFLDDGVIDQPNFDYLWEELDHSALPYDEKDLPLQTKIRLIEEDVTYLFEQLDKLLVAESEYPIEGRTAEEMESAAAKEESEEDGESVSPPAHKLH